MKFKLLIVACVLLVGVGITQAEQPSVPARHVAVTQKHVFKPKPASPPPSTPVENTPTPVSPPPAPTGNNILNLINNVRVSRGLPALVEHADLDNSALQSVTNMINNKSCCDHGNWEAWFAGLPYGWTGENIAACQRSDEELVQAWVDSPPHLENILRPEFKYFGVFTAYGEYMGMQCRYAANHFGG